MSLPTLRLDELDHRRTAVLDGIAERGEIYQVGTESAHFVLGPQSILSIVLGLYDEEYGWPTSVDANAPIEEFVPARHCHPFIVREGQLLAISVSQVEYREICRQRSLGSG
jgi:hypothetical protein